MILLKQYIFADNQTLNYRNSQVNISSLDGKIVGLYFSATWCGPCHRFTPKLVEVYNELSSKGGKFEVVFISSDEDDDSFSTYFLNMPWLAIPFSDSQTRDNLSDLFDVVGIPCLVILDESGKILTNKGVSIVKDYGSEAYPFTPERMEKMKEEEEYARKNQTLQRVLVSSSRDFVIANNGNKVFSPFFFLISILEY